MTSSPRKTYRLSRDKLNNPLWTGRLRAGEEDDQNAQLTRFRRAFSGAFGGEDATRNMAHDRLTNEGTQVESTGDAKQDAADALYRLLENESAYAPPKEKEKVYGEFTKPKRKGVRT